MAKEAGKPKPNVKKKNEKKGKSKRPTFCPNSSKSLNLSTTRSQRFEAVNAAALKKNNEELAKTLNQYKEALARIDKEKTTKDAEIMDLRMEIGQLRAAPDPQEIEAEVQRRVKQHMSKINADIRSAIDHSIGLSNILTQLCVSSSRASVSVSKPGGETRNPDIGGSKLRPVFRHGQQSGNTWSRGRSANSPVKQLSKVSPMVAGHAISRPRIQLERMDLSSLSSQFQENNEESGEDLDHEQEQHHQEELNHPEEVDHEDDAVTPPHAPPTRQAAFIDEGRNMFDLTNIREESSMLEDSVLSTMEETILSPSTNMEAVQEENQEDIELEQEASTSRVLTSTSRRSSVRSLLQAPLHSQSPAPFSPDIVSTQADQSPAPPDTSPYVLDTDTTPVGLPRHHQQKTLEEPSAQRKTSQVSPNHSALTESFLESMMDINDPMEGPSWLFASVKKKKRRSSVVKKLSCIMSDLDNTETNTSHDDSDIGGADSGSGGFVLDQDLRQSNEDVEVDHFDQENVPVTDDDLANMSGVRNLVTPRAPLSSLKTCVDEGGNLVNLKEARVMLNNVSMDHITGSTEQHESPLLGGRKKTMTLDELFSLGTKEDCGDTSTSTKRKFRSDSKMEDQTKAQKRPRATELGSTAASTSGVKLQNLEVRLEKNNVGLGSNEDAVDNTASASSSEPQHSVSEDPQPGGRSRRTKAAVSYKEPALGKKLRQVNISSIFWF